ncbi:MAG: hypothetical protein JOY90_07895 [Bradyrhizobium sp.]|uniref:hypothetical protein n=1 Tax=Bradyrhizobium sp. TaxID=376 RepID=UPI001DD9DD4E|nr:hypothetical protein [Bradyrhizobium sp.]MBV9560367.1 hypothetical protein [Bradyrhizobium sp.]
MGIKRSSARVLQFRRPTAGEDLTENDLTELAGSRAPPRTPRRQRGLWSFLTWQFVIAPIVAAASSFIGNGHASATDDQDDRIADHQKGQPDAASDHGQAAVGTAAETPDDGRNDQTDSSLRLLGATPKGLADRDGLPHEEHAGPAVAHDIVATAPAGDGEVDDGLDAASSDDCRAALHKCIAAAGSSGDASGVSSGSPTEIPPPIVIGELPSGGLHVDVSVGGELNLSLPTTGVVSTLPGSLADMLATVGLSSPLDLKDYLGFDLHVNAGGELVASDLGTLLDLSLSLATLNMVSPVVSPAANTVSSVVNLVADGLPILGTSNPLDQLLGNDTHHHSVIGHLGDLTSLLGNGSISHELPGHPGELTSVIAGGDIGGGDPISALVDKLDCLKMLPDALAATPPGSGSSTDLPVVGAVADHAHVGIVVDAIDFPSPVQPEGDVLFHGNSYSDYHVALQSAGPSSGSGSIAPMLNSVSGILDAPLPAHVDSPGEKAAPSTSTGATVQHPDALLIHIATTLDDLSLRSHTH